MSRFDYMQIHDDRSFSSWERKSIDQLTNHIVVRDIDTYTMIDIPHFDNLTRTANYSDEVRMEWLVDHPNGVYVDCDCFLKERFEPPIPDTVYLPLNDNFLDGKSPDIFLIYVNNNNQWIRNNFSKRIRDSWIEKNVEKKDEFYGFPLSLSKQWSGFEWIPKDIYIHDYQTLKQELERKRKTMEQQNITRNINDVTNEQFVALDMAVNRIKTFMLEIAGLFNQQYTVIKSQEEKIAELEELIKESQKSPNTLSLNQERNSYGNSST